MKNENLSFWLDVTKITIGVLLAVVGWIVGHWLIRKRTLEQKRRELISEHLISAYRILTSDIPRIKDETFYDKLGSVLLDIQLFGSQKQVKMAVELAKEIKPEKTFNVEPLVQSLRDDLRKELDLSQVNDQFVLIGYEASTNKKENPPK